MNGTLLELAREPIMMRRHQKAFQPLPVYHEMPVLLGNQVFLCKLEQMFRYSWPCGSNQLSQVVVPQRYGQSHPTTMVGDAETLAQIEQSKREALLKRTAYEVRATQL